MLVKLTPVVYFYRFPNIGCAGSSTQNGTCYTR